MEIKILGDLQHFWQWDTNRKLLVDDDGKCNEVHFGNGPDSAIVCLIKEENGKRLVDVPNILLQKGDSIYAYMYIETKGEGYTRKARCFPVRPRAKPDDYVYTETEVLNYTYLDNRIKDLEGEGLANAVADYLEKNPVESGATEEEAAQIQQNKTDIERLAQDKLDASALPEAVNEALAQAQASGAFKGDPGEDGAPGPAGPAGADGKTPIKGTDYFTEADKQEIAEAAAGLVEVPEATMKPLTFTGAVNATYDGSEAVSVEIPVGGGSGGETWELIANSDTEVSYSVNYFKWDADNSGNPFALKKAVLLVWCSSTGDWTFINAGIQQYAWSVVPNGNAAGYMYRIEFTKDLDGVWMAQVYRAKYNTSTYLPSENYSYFAGKRANVTVDNITSVFFETGRGTLAKYALYGVRG